MRYYLERALNVSNAGLGPRTQNLMTSRIFFVLVVIIVVLFGGCTLKVADQNTSADVNANATVNSVPEPAGTPSSGGGESAPTAAADVIADLYKQHDAKRSPFFQTKDRALVDKFFTKRLADLIWKDAKNSSGEVGAIDGDPLYNAQDIEIKNFAIGKPTIKGDVASVLVTFTNYDIRQMVTFQLKQVGTAWKIDDIGYGGGDSLMKWLTSTYPEKSSAVTSPTGEFEGKYQVGETTCVVKPVKQAFEIRWAKGTGTEYFFYKDVNVFESEEDKSGGRNEFRFSDENYNSGTFVRADGKSFAVSRAK